MVALLIEASRFQAVGGGAVRKLSEVAVRDEGGGHR